MSVLQMNKLKLRELKEIFKVAQLGKTGLLPVFTCGFFFSPE